MMPTKRSLTKELRRLRWAVGILCGLTWLLGGVTAHAQGIPAGWQPLGGPPGRISHLAASPDGADLYAVSVAATHRADDQTQWQSSGKAVRSDALYRSQDGGATWQPLTNDLPPAPITALYAGSKALYAALQGGLWQSTDRGATWRRISLGRDDLIIQPIVSSADGRTLFLGATPTDPPFASYVYKSSDGGRSWTSVEIPGSPLADLIPHPKDAKLLYLTTQKGQLRRSTDAGETWATVKTAQEEATQLADSPAYLAVSPDGPDTMLLARSYASDRGDSLAIERSTDGGASWRKPAATGLPTKAKARLLTALRGGVLLLNTDQGTFRSVDNGSTWQPLEGPLSSGGVADFLPALEPSKTPTAVPGSAGPTVLAATGYGLFVSRDGGALWQAHGSGLPINSSIAGLLTDARRAGQIWAITDNRPIAGTAAPPLVLRSLDDGRTWTPAARGLPDAVATAWAIDPSAPDAIAIVTQESFSRTSDGGLTWQTTGIEPGNRAALAIAPSNGRVIYLGGRPALRSTDRGQTWQSMPVVLPGQDAQSADVTGLVVDPANPEHVWAGFDGGVAESLDGGRTWRTAGLEGKRVRRLWADPQAGNQFYAGVAEDGIYRLDGATGAWTVASKGLPPRSTVLALAPDGQKPDVLWATRDGGGIYRSTDGGANWTNVGAGFGDNLAQTIAPDFSAATAENKRADSGLLVGMPNAGIWAQRSGNGSSPSAPLRALDARIEVVWPHDGAPVAEAKAANIGLRLFAPASLQQPSCNWTPRVTVWQAVDTGPAELLGEASPRTVDGRPFPFWELNDVDVSKARDGDHKLYFTTQVAGLQTATSVWAHAADSRTYFPQQDVPSGLASGPIDAVDARIQIVWPHDAAGAELPPEKAPLANVAVMLFKHGTRLSVPVGWQPPGLTLYGAWNHEVGKLLSKEPVPQVRKSGAITYPVWEFTNIPVARATDPANRLYLWVQADGIESHPTIWAHGTDARTSFPVPDEPIQGCTP